MKFFILLLALLTPVLSPKAASPSPETKTILNSISLRYKDLKAWKAKFTQETINPALGTNSFNTGEFAFQSPNRFRFSILTTETSDFISNGKEAWHVNYQQGRTKAGYVKHFKDVKNFELDRYLILLRGISFKSKKEEVDFYNKFEVSGTTVGDTLKLSLTPKKSSEIAEILIETKNADKVPYQMTITDALGVKTKILITAWEKVKAIDPKEFVPAIPAGSKVETY